MIPLGLAIAVGWRTRVVAAVSSCVFTYCELIDAALYLNHYWFVTLVLALLVVVPTSDRTVPAPRRVGAALPGRFVYVVAGIAKLNRDWLVDGEPMGMWLAGRTDTPIVGRIFDEPWAGHVASWMGAAFDLTIVGWLLWRRTRLAVWLAIVVFHVAHVAAVRDRRVSRG